MKQSILREIKDHRVSLVAYCGAALAFLVLYIALYPTIKNSMSQFQKIYESYPPELYKAMGIDNLNIGNLGNYLAIENFSFLWPFMAIFFAVSRAGATLAGEIEKGIMGFYLMLPISRIKLFFAKYIGCIIGCILFVLVSVLVIWPLSHWYNNPIGLSNLLWLSLLSLLFMWAMYAAGLALSAVFSDRGKVYMLMGGVLLVSYVLKIVANLQKDWNWLENYSVFHYYNAQEVLSKNQLPLDSALVFIGIAVVCSVIGLLIFKQRDISV